MVVTEHIKFFGKMPIGKPPGRCIYCGSTDGLTDEHIVAFCLATDAYVPKASCKKCAKETSYLEGYAGRHIFGPLRIHFKIQSRRKKIELGLVDVTFHTERGVEIRRLPRERLPAILTLPILEPPGLFHGRPPTPIKHYQHWTWTADYADARMAEFLKPGDERWWIPATTNPLTFSRMLAKIAHALAVGRLGVDSFVPYLPPLILGKDDNAAHFIGGAAPPTIPLPKVPYSEKTHHHTLTFGCFSSPGKPDLLVATVRLFLHIGSPTYSVIVGEPLPAAMAQLRVPDNLARDATRAHWWKTTGLALIVGAISIGAIVFAFTR
jgi:hypothetical protein